MYLNKVLRLAWAPDAVVDNGAREIEDVDGRCRDIVLQSD